MMHQVRFLQQMATGSRCARSCTNINHEEFYYYMKFVQHYFSTLHFCRQLAKSKNLKRKNFLQLLATRFLKYVSYVYVSGMVTRLRTRLILIWSVFILTCSHTIKNDTACSITMCPIKFAYYESLQHSTRLEQLTTRTNWRRSL